MSIYLRRCKKCGKSYDIGINMSLCPDCRLKKEMKRKEGKYDRNTF